MAATGQLKLGYDHSPFQTAVLAAMFQTAEAEINSWVGASAMKHSISHVAGAVLCISLGQPLRILGDPCSGSNGDTRLKTVSAVDDIL